MIRGMTSKCQVYIMESEISSLEIWPDTGDSEGFLRVWTKAGQYYEFIGKFMDSVLQPFSFSYFQENTNPTDCLKLYVWEDVLTDYTPGVMFALAKDTEHARKLLIEKYGDELDDMRIEPREVINPEGFIVWGGG